jgi:predicted alternative tryptophan synthase beta-subunit
VFSQPTRRQARRPPPPNIFPPSFASLTNVLQHTGSLGIAISEAVEVAAKDPATNYALGSVRDAADTDAAALQHATSLSAALHEPHPTASASCTHPSLTNTQVLNHVLLHQTIIGEEALKQVCAGLEGVGSGVGG